MGVAKKLDLFTVHAGCLVDRKEVVAMILQENEQVLKTG
jgi:hypothetical protein